MEAIMSGRELLPGIKAGYYLSCPVRMGLTGVTFSLVRRGQRMQIQATGPAGVNNELPEKDASPGGHLRREALQDPQDPVIPKPPRNTTKQYTAHWEASADAERRGGRRCMESGDKESDG
ncbi:hypothetical protein NQZ68_040424 [Dissostichus eleginoides]|nr:hypothetical protein NQZ68_040424 [Dissostichus eleginoides]